MRGRYAKLVICALLRPALVGMSAGSAGPCMVGVASRDRCCECCRRSFEDNALGGRICSIFQNGVTRGCRTVESMSFVEKNTHTVKFSAERRRQGPYSLVKISACNR